MQLVVLAAGRGSRLPKKYRYSPKCLVRIHNKEIINYNLDFFNKFNNKIIVSGYKKNALKKKTKHIGFKYIHNKDYAKTNMVHSLLLAKEKIVDDVVIMYGDIIFNKKVFNLLNKNIDILPVNTNWLKNWKSRMGFKKLLLDAENIIVENNQVKTIGSKIDPRSLPKYQYMGIMKLKKKTLKKILNFYISINNKKIDMTTFINKCIQNKILRLTIKKYKDYWYEIDNIKDLNFANREIKKW